ncbi:MAG: hypothetical protein HY042_13190 [Spirochaetia bacterium]|nr:hypothetical protein [Spirochaetia bacterium]
MRFTALLSVFILALSSCIVYHVTPPYAPYVKPQLTELKAAQVPLFVEVRQTESSAFTENADKTLAKEAKDYNMAVLLGLKKAVESRPGVTVDPEASTKVIIASELPESSLNSAWVGCLGLLTLLVFPIWNSYDYVINVTVIQDGRQLKRTSYRYSTTQIVGWLMPLANLFVSTWKSNMYASVGNRGEDVGRLTDTFTHRVADDVFAVAVAAPRNGE